MSELLLLQPWQAKQTWAGYAIRSQGHFVLAGWSSYAGKLWNLDEPENRFLTFESKIRNLGLALGGGVSVNLLFCLNVKSVAHLEGRSFGNGSNFHFDIPATRLAKLAWDLRMVYRLAKASHEFYELVTGAAELYNTLNTNKTIILEKKVGDASVMAGVTHGFQGVMDIRLLAGRGGYVDNL